MKFFTTFQISDIDFFVVSENEKIIKIGLNEEPSDDLCMIYKTKDDKLFKQCYKELVEYFTAGRKKFTFKIKLLGTEFQKKVWKALLKIPYGKTASYKDIALKINNPKAVRAVGLANKNNPLPIVIPCHRVIGKNGKLTGYSSGLDIKKKLLDLERASYKKS